MQQRIVMCVKLKSKMQKKRKEKNSASDMKRGLDMSCMKK